MADEHKTGNQKIPVPTGSLRFTGLKPRYEHFKTHWVTNRRNLALIVIAGIIGAVVGYWLAGLVAVGVALLFVVIGLLLPAARYKVERVERG